MFEEKKIKSESIDSNEPIEDTEATEIEVSVPLVYLKCSLCGGVRIEADWSVNEEITNGPTGFLICPICNCINVQSVSEADTSLIDSYKEIIAPFTKKDVDDLDKAKKEIKVQEKLEKALIPKIKPFLVENGITQFDFEGHKMIMAYQNRGTMNEEMLLSVIETKIEDTRDKLADCQDDDMCQILEELIATLRSAIVIETKTNPDQVKLLLSNGGITLEELSPCMIPNIIPVFYLNSKPKKEKATPEFGGMF